MTSTNSWRSSTTVRADPEHVIDTLTDPDACARWSPIPFTLDAGHGSRLRPGTTARVSGRLFGAHVGFNLHTLTADARHGLQMRAQGPIDIFVDYTLKPVRAGCALDACIAIHPPGGRWGRLLARASARLLAGGTLDHALERIAQEAERAAGTKGSPSPCCNGGDRAG
jgi:Polyketide cyclase / dehydrase and lipid transport